MANATTTVRVAPTGAALTDGFSSKVSFAADPNVTFWEKSIQPPGLDGGDPIDQTTMFNAAYRVQVPRSLITLTTISLVVAYDPIAYDDIISNLINVNTDVTVLFSNSDTLDFYGFLQSFEPQTMEEGSQPEANVTIQPTNWDPDALVEAGPNYVTALGSDEV